MKKKKNILPIPQSYTSVTRSRCHVIGIWVECYAIDIRDMSNKNSQTMRLICGPQARRFIVSTACKVISRTGKANLPNGKHMAFVGHKTSPCLQTPQSDGAVFRARKKLRSVWTERQSIYLFLKKGDKRYYTYYFKNTNLMCKYTMSFTP